MQIDQSLMNTHVTLLDFFKMYSVPKQYFLICERDTQSIAPAFKEKGSSSIWDNKNFIKFKNLLGLREI